MGWRPENEVDDEEKEQGKRIMLREEATTIIMSIIEAQIAKGIDAVAATDVAIDQAPKILKFLNDRTPF